MGIRVRIQEAIVIGKDWLLKVALDDPTNPGTFEVTLTVDEEERKFGLKSGGTSLPVRSKHEITVGGARTWTVVSADLRAGDARATITLTEKSPGTRSGSDSGAVLEPAPEPVDA
jgi:hypothetical protein